jgi:hypothetical protein
MIASVSTGSQNWRELYRAALFEIDEKKMPSRIAEAERALVLRERELFPMSSDNIDEALAVNNALYALHALRSCFELRTRTAAAA